MQTFEILKAFVLKEIRNIKKNWLFAIVLALVYGLEAYFIQGEILAGHGDYRPLIFIPALAAVVFGPLFGGIVGGFGNLTNDIINKYIVEGKALHIGHLVGFLGNFIGAFVVGLLSVDIRSEQYKSLLDREALKDYTWNVISSSIGLGAITGAIIGFGLWLVGKVPYEIGVSIAGSIMYWNSLFMLLLYVVFPLYAIIEKRNYLKMKKEKEFLRKVEVVKGPEDAFATIEKGEIIEGDPIEREWFIVALRVKNNSAGEQRFRVELIGPDIIQPSVKYTRKIKEGEYDDITFSLYPLGSGERHFRARIIPWVDTLEQVKENIRQKDNEVLFELKYKAKPEASAKLSSITSMVGMLALLALLFKGIYDLISGGAVTGFTVALAFFFAEIVLIIIWYIWKKKSLATE